VGRHNIQECMMDSMLVHMLHTVRPLAFVLDIALHMDPLAFVLVFGLGIVLVDHMEELVDHTFLVDP